VPAGRGPRRRLTRGFHPAWSPDGRQVAFFRTYASRRYDGDDVTYLYVLNRRTGRVRRVSSMLMALEGANDYATAGLDWQVAR
jgi:Tol biopolymer transport system component